ncbi:MAG: TetR/AcrR family transcriptional regulator [Flavobacterium sp.]|nr:TetR/AcrR family transcriptional regulator [Flavobacterium sp.]
MATTKKTATKSKQVDDSKIIELYMNSVLTENASPKNAYLFCKENAIEESDFYSFFGSIDNVKQVIWVKFFENAITAINNEEGYATYTDKNKLLTLFYTLFEILTLNRSYVLFSLEENKNNFKNLKDLVLFRKEFKAFVSTIIDEKEIPSITKLDKITKPLFSEGAWVQFLLILKFWMDDSSKGFEKTDILIEKSVNTAVDIFNTKPLESLIDLGKFLWKENKMS